MGKTEWVYTLQLAICPVILWEKNAPSNNMSLEGLRVPLVPLDSPHYESESKVQGPTNISSNIALDHTPNFPKPLARNKFVHKDSRYSISATFFVGTFGTLGRYISNLCLLFKISFKPTKHLNMSSKNLFRKSSTVSSTYVETHPLFHPSDPSAQVGSGTRIKPGIHRQIPSLNCRFFVDSPNKKINHKREFKGLFFYFGERGGKLQTMLFFAVDFFCVGGISDLEKASRD